MCYSSPNVCCKQQQCLRDRVQSKYPPAFALCMDMNVFHNSVESKVPNTLHRFSVQKPIDNICS